MENGQPLPGAKAGPSSQPVSRYALAINIIVVVRGPVCKLQLVDFDPIHWKTWFPFFLSKTGDFDTPSSEPETLRQQLETIQKHLGGREELIRAATASFTEAFGLTPASVAGAPDAPDTFAIKFSKSQNEWTAYHNVFAMGHLLPNDMASLEKAACVQTFISLDASLGSVLTEGKFQGKPVVDNLLNLLRSPTFVQGLVAVPS